MQWGCASEEVLLHAHGNRLDLNAHELTFSLDHDGARYSSQYPSDSSAPHKEKEPSLHVQVHVVLCNLH